MIFVLQFVRLSMCCFSWFVFVASSLSLPTLSLSLGRRVPSRPPTEGGWKLQSHTLCSVGHAVPTRCATGVPIGATLVYCKQTERPPLLAQPLSFLTLTVPLSLSLSLHVIGFSC